MIYFGSGIYLNAPKMYMVHNFQEYLEYRFRQAAGINNITKNVLQSRFDCYVCCWTGFLMVQRLMSDVYNIGSDLFHTRLAYITCIK